VTTPHEDAVPAIRVGGAPACTYLMQTASSSEPPSERGVGVPSRSELGDGNS
jgi:hypothetical protein